MSDETQREEVKINEKINPVCSRVDGDGNAGGV
jgi:hypothetical protein